MIEVETERSFDKDVVQAIQAAGRLCLETHRDPQTTRLARFAVLADYVICCGIAIGDMSSQELEKQFIDGLTAEGADEAATRKLYGAIDLEERRHMFTLAYKKQQSNQAGIVKRGFKGGYHRDLDPATFIADILERHTGRLSY